VTRAAPPAGGTALGAPAGPRRPGWLGATGAGVLAGLAGSVLLFRHAVRVDVQPSPAPGAPDVLVPHYATPWILAAAAAALAGLLLAVALVSELVRRRTDAVLVPNPSVPPGVVTAPASRVEVRTSSGSVGPVGHPVPDVHPADVWRPPAQART
jgi:hypothetical protein